MHQNAELQQSTLETTPGPAGATPCQIARELSEVTRELMAAESGDLELVGRLLEFRAILIARVAALEPAAFAPDFPALLAAVREGDAAIEKFVLLRRGAAAEWLRLNHMRTGSVPHASISLSA